jgi:hypothetical protein
MAAVELSGTPTGSAIASRVLRVRATRAPTRGSGFDSITDNPNLAGGQFMFWDQQKATSRRLPLAIC